MVEWGWGGGGVRGDGDGGGGLGGVGWGVSSGGRWRRGRWGGRGRMWGRKGCVTVGHSDYCSSI